MAQIQLRWRDFTRGWYATGAADAQPEGTLRRAIGIAQVKTTALRSRWGSIVIADLDAHSVHRFADRRFQGVDTRYFIDGTTVIQMGLDGTKLTALRMAPTVGVQDYLFVAGGNLAFKVDQDGVASQWGIDPPADGFTATVGTSGATVIDALDNAGSWTGSGAALADEATIKQEGANSMKMTVAASTTGTATKAISVDLAVVDVTVASPNEDCIEVWLRLDHPERVDAVQLAFDVGAGNFATDYYTRDVVMSADLPASEQLSQQTAGLNDVATGVDPATGSPVVLSNPRTSASVANQAAQTSFARTLDTWVRLRLPKVTFQRIGTSGTGWESVAAARLTIRTNATGQAIGYWDDFRLNGGTGLQGTYRYQVVFLNDESGSRSNPNTTEVIAANVNRSAVTLAGLPVATDPQVTHLEVYRTVGNGVLKFRVAKLAIGTTSWVDEVADAATLNSTPGATLMTDIQMQTDNARPNDSWDDTWGPYAGCAWWCRSPVPGEKGRVFFSPAGRAEASVDFMDVSSDDEPTMKGVVYNGSNYVFTTAGCYQIIGTGPFAFRRVYGVPGTLWPLTVALTPYGVAYLALDGPRMFDGVGSRLISSIPVSLLFRGETLEDVSFTT